MNATDGRETTKEAFAYLNQTKHSLLPDDIILGHLVNYPYRLAFSLMEAVNVHYQEAVASSGLLINLQSALDIIGYFFSTYAVACFVIALILNRFVLMASLRSNTRTVLLPVWSRYTVHLMAIVPLVYNITQALCQLEVIAVFPPVEVPFFLARTFLIFAWSHCVETFITTTTNLKPLEESDYTIFELSLQFYFLCQSPQNYAQLQGHLPDFLTALIGRVLIHTVEMLDLRRYRLWSSTILNFFSIGYLAYRVQHSGLDSLPAFTRIRHFPKIFSIFLILLSVLTYLLACLVRKNPFSSRQFDTSELQFHSFMHNWWNHLNCTGEEEFSSVISKLALLLCSGTESMEKGIHREFSPLNAPQNVHPSYFVSPYMNRISTIPDDADTSAKCVDQTTNSNGTLAFVTRVKLTFNLIKHGVLFYLKGKYKARKGSTNKSLKRSRAKTQTKDCNRFITDKNYVKFLTKPRKVGTENVKEVLLSDEDLSEDYSPIENDYEDSDTAELEIVDVNNTPSGENMASELSQLLAPNDTQNLHEDMKWFMSVWSILSRTQFTEKRITRSTYASLNPEGILAEVMVERSSNLKLQSTLYENEKVTDNDTSDQQMELVCVVCRINQRNVVLWPCRCFAICEDCRVSLGLRGFKSCVCCRSEVHGYSKLNAV